MILYIVTSLVLRTYSGVPLTYMRWLRSRARAWCRKNGDTTPTAATFR